MSRIWVTSLPSFSSGEVERAKYVSACENCHAREKREALHLPCGWRFSRSLAHIITEEVPVVYFRIVFVLILKHDLRRFLGYLFSHDCGPHFPEQRLEIEPP